MTKSLEDIMRQMEAQKSAEQQRRFVEERALNEQRERQRREHLERIRVYESYTNFTSYSSASGGGSLKNISNGYIADGYVSYGYIGNQ
jgi:hypothetical protein